VRPTTILFIIPSMHRGSGSMADRWGSR
jgi:hypothetical protein